MNWIAACILPWEINKGGKSEAFSSLFRQAYGDHCANAFLTTSFFAVSTGEADDVGKWTLYKPNEISSYPQPRKTAKMSDVGKIKTAIEF